MIKRKSVFERVEEDKKVLALVTKGKSDDETKIMLCHCRYYKLGRYKKLNKEERLLYDFLNKNGLSARTMYKHFTALSHPQNIRELLHKKEISIANACSRAFALTKMREGNTSKELMTEIKNIVGGLEWKGLNKIQI
ncbi:hypothetical protein HZA97_02610 [Candidatus Woesearchaeota archaeon]|nr:hypothetical protein [Candidatus Woesearchaeota archaeon]